MKLAELLFEYEILSENIEKNENFQKLIKYMSGIVRKLEKYDPKEEHGDWREVEWEGKTLATKNLLKNDGRMLAKISKRYDEKEFIQRLKAYAEALADQFNTVSQSKRGTAKEGTYALNSLLAYKLNDGGITFLVLIDPDETPVGFVGLAAPKKPCNQATQIKYITTNPKYRGKGVGGHLYRCGGIIAQQDLGMKGITSDHTESTTAAAGRVWDRLGKHFTKVSSEAGNEEFDYTGKETPDDKEDDCTLPGEGSAATDSAWELKGGSKSKANSILQKQLANGEAHGQPEDLGNIIQQLWNNTYEQSRKEGGLREAIQKIIKEIL